MYIWRVLTCFYKMREILKVIKTYMRISFAVRVNMHVRASCKTRTTIANVIFRDIFPSEIESNLFSNLDSIFKEFRVQVNLDAT